MFGFIRKGKVTNGARYDGRMLRDIVTIDNAASDVWADIAYRSPNNEVWLRQRGRVSRIHRRKPKWEAGAARQVRAHEIAIAL